MSEKTRAYLYRVTTAAIPLLTAYGVVSEEVAPLWVALGAAVLATGTAARHTSTG